MTAVNDGDVRELLLGDAHGRAANDGLSGGVDGADVRRVPLRVWLALVGVGFFVNCQPSGT